MSVPEVLDSLFILMIKDYLEEFLGLIFGNDNCLIWAAMINIALIVDEKPDQITNRVDDIMAVI